MRTAAILSLAVLVLGVRCGATPDSVGDQLVKRSGLDAAQCVKSDSTGYTCDLFTGGREVLRDCAVTEEGFASGCIRAASATLTASSAWDEVESAFGEVGLRMTIAPTASEAFGWESSLELRSDSGQGPIRAFIFPTATRAAAFSGDSRALAQLVYYSPAAEEVVLDRAQQGAVVQRGRVLVFIEREYRTRLRDRVDEVLARLSPAFVAG